MIEDIGFFDLLQDQLLEQGFAFIGNAVDGLVRPVTAVDDLNGFNMTFPGQLVHGIV
ncbi:hypothetical protein D3C76_1849320 [compost metagenome]